MEFTKKQELIYNLTIENVMRKNVITVSPDTTIKQLKEIMKTNRISGVPVLDGGRLIGVASIEDLIKALEAGELDLPVSQRMTRQLITVMEKESIVEAIKKFSHFHVGRLLVVNEQGDLTGILTGSDITRGLLEAISMTYENEEAKREPRINYQEYIVSDFTSLILRYHIKEKDFKSGGSASSKIKRAFEQLGIPPTILRRVAICAYEAEMNLIIHADKGGELVTEIQPDLIHITITDHGPGIVDVDQAITPGYSTAPAWIQELGFGAGMGLANIQKCADSFRIESKPGIGTQLDIQIKL